LLARVLDGDDDEAIGRRQHAVEHADDLVGLAFQHEPRARGQAARRCERGADDGPVAVALSQEAPFLHGQRAVVAVRRGHGEVHAQHQFLGERHELRGARVQRQHHLRLHAGDARHLADGLDGRRGQQAAGGEPGAHAHPTPRHRDLAEHEAIAALDEAHDALGHGAERDDARHSDGDTGDGEDVTTEGATQTLDHMLASDGGTGLQARLACGGGSHRGPREIRVAALDHRLASDGGAQPRDVLRLALPFQPGFDRQPARRRVQVLMRPSPKRIRSATRTRHGMSPSCRRRAR